MNWIQNWTLSISLTFWRFPHHSMHTHTHAYDIIWRIVAHQLCKNLFLSRLHHAALHYIIQCDFKSMHIDLFSFFFLNFEFHQVNFFWGIFSFWYDEIFIEIIFSIWISCYEDIDFDFDLSFIEDEEKKSLENVWRRSHFSKHLVFRRWISAKQNKQIVT